MANMLSLGSAGIVLAVQTQHAPSDEEWAEMMQCIRGVALPRLRVLVFTDGGGPNARQRGEFTDHLAGQSAPISVVSGNPLVKGIATAISWFNPKIRVFSPASVPDAFAHVGVDDKGAAEVLRHAKSMALKLSGGVVRALERA